ncbi:ATP-grasp fold amidoligase family protein [Clostridium tagluense]|uniref:ATP-grasp fold amidoligase family protein n=1 Tax=Clostridium tagluense TaxID=360422 RepID=UPI001CF56404|nr:ATP-grasp fold amidoligase family protein [Clostridium tagluense]MCB2296774.1 carbonic anhydrase [Clostridium tagluense]
MDYKKLLPSQKLRLRILKLMDFLPDKLMIELQYKIATGRKVNLKKPLRFTEKLQWYKLYHRDSLMTQCVDKYSVREYINSKGYGDILVPLYGVYDRSEDIDFDKLPDRFVLKTTNGSHTNILCEDKSKLDVEATRQKLNRYMKAWSGKVGREWAYYDVKPHIICEKYLDKDENNDLIDYKFFCFNGEPYCLYVIVERYLEDGLKLGIYNTDFEKKPYVRSDIQGLTTDVVKPKNFEEMVEIARDLSKDFPHVRVDFYNIDGEIVFGELTFYDGSGYKGFVADEFDFILGEKFRLPETKARVYNA